MIDLKKKNIYMKESLIEFYVKYNLQIIKTNKKINNFKKSKLKKFFFENYKMLTIFKKYFIVFSLKIKRKKYIF